MGTSFVGKLLNRTPVPYVSTRGNVGRSLLVRRGSDQVEQMRAMEINTTIFAIVNRTSNSFSQVNWRLYRKSPTGNQQDRKSVV